MRGLRVLVLALALLGACRTIPNSTCQLHAMTHTAFRDLLSKDWSTTTPDTVAQLWPSPIMWGSEAGGDRPCSGTASFSNLERVIANECLCCDTFAFTDVPSSGKCERYLSSATLVRHFPDDAPARHAAALLLAAVDGTKRLDLPSTTVTRQISPRTTEITQLQVSEALGGWRVRLLTYRVTDDAP